MDRIKILNRNHIKYLAIIAMLIDHIAWAFVPTASPLGQVLHFIGRLTGPTMAIFVAEGYIHTSDRRKYAIRLGIFALISWVPFSLFEEGRWPTLRFGVIYSLFLAYLAIWIWDQAKLIVEFKILIVMILCLFTMYGDWSYADVLWAFFYYLFYKDNIKKWFVFILIIAMDLFRFISAYGIKREMFQFGLLLVPIIFIFLYNGEAGSKKPFHKWFFYIFYPAHLLVLFVLKCVLK